MYVRTIYFAYSLMLALPGLFSACSPSAPTEVAVPEDARIFTVEGTFLKIESQHQWVIIQHDEIPGYMGAMTMPFVYQNENEFKEISAGDRIAFRLVVTDTESWIDQIVRLADERSGQALSVPSVRFGPDVEPLEVGDPMSNYTFTNELGRSFQLDDFAGQSYALTFIYTRCPLPDFCPRMALNFAKVQEILKTDPAMPTNWQLLTLSFDPAYDTPEILRRYAAVYPYDTNHWSWATGNITDIDSITEQFGLRFSRQATNEFDHTLRTVVVDAAGQVHQIFIGNLWTSDQLATALREAATILPR